MIIIILTKYYNPTLVATRRDAPVLQSGTLWTLYFSSRQPHQ